MLKLETFTPHMTAYGITYPYAYNRRLIRPDGPDELITFREIPGPDPIDNIEGSVYVAAFQIAVRGPREDQFAARDVMHLVDKFMQDETLWPFMCGDTKVFNTGSLSSSPAYLDSDEFNRSIFACNYFARASR